MLQHTLLNCDSPSSTHKFNALVRAGLDSYQEADLGVLRERWTEALEKRREYLDNQLQTIMAKEGV